MFGAFIAVRRTWLPRLPDGVVNEDLWLLCRLVKDGGRVVYEPQACSHEPGLQSRHELERRTRIAAGRVLLLGDMRGLPPSFLWRLASHKLGRLGLPFMLAGALMSSLALAGRPRYRLPALLQVGVYSIGALAARGHPAPLLPAGLTQAITQFTVGNVATAAGVLRGLRRRQPAAWRTVR